MGRNLIAHVEVDGTWYRPGQVPPPEVAERITNPKAWEGGQAPDPAPAETTSGPEVKEPPRGGPGSSAKGWGAYADHLKVDYPDGASAKEIAALVDEHKAKG